MADLEARGIPTVGVATEEFIEGAKAQARSLGTDPALVFIPHPVQDRTDEELYRLCEIPGDTLVAGARGIAEGGPASLAGKTVNKFRPGGLLIVRAGGDAGMFSGIIGGWSAGGPRGSIPVTKEVKP